MFIRLRTRLRLARWSIMVAASAFWAVVPAHATLFAPTSLTWHFDDVTFTDGGSGTGFVVILYSDGTKQVTDWNLSVSGLVAPGGAPVPSFNFTPSDSTISLTGDPLFDVLQQDPFELNWSVGSLPIEGGTVDILDGFYGVNGVDFGGMTGDMTTLTPEPPAWTLLGVGALALLALAYRRRRALDSA